MRTALRIVAAVAALAAVGGLGVVRAQQKPVSSAANSVVVYKSPT